LRKEFHGEPTEWIDEWVALMKPWCGHFVNLETLTQLKDTCCGSAFQATRLAICQDTQLVPLDNEIFESTCVGTRELIVPFDPSGGAPPVGKTLFFCRSRFVSKVVVSLFGPNFETNLLAGDVTVTLLSTPAGTNTAPVALGVPQTVTVGESAVFHIEAPKETHGVPAKGFDYCVEVSDGKGGIYTVIVQVLCGPLKCTSKKGLKCCSSLYQTKNQTLSIEKNETKALQLCPLSGQGCGCLLDDTVSFECRSPASKHWSAAKLEQVQLSLIYGTQDQGQGDVKVSLVAGKDTIIDFVDKYPLESDKGSITLTLDPSEFTLAHKGPWKIELTPTVPIKIFSGTIMPVCAQWTKTPKV